MMYFSLNRYYTCSHQNFAIIKIYSKISAQIAGNEMVLIRP